MQESAVLAPAILVPASMALENLEFMLSSTLLMVSVPEIQFVAPLFSVDGSFLPVSYGHP